MEKKYLNERTYEFAVDVVKLCKKVKKEDKEFVITHQLMKSGTSVGANYTEARHAQSKKDFVAKLYICLKEAQESDYWLRLLTDTEYVKKSETELLRNNLRQINNMLVKTIKTTKSNMI